MAEPRSVTEVGPGDYVKTLDGAWRPIVSNSAYLARRLPRSWVVTTEGGARFGMWEILGYAKRGDLGSAFARDGGA